jgi:hypothetical protein
MSNNEPDPLYGRSFWHRLNQAHAEAGQTAVMPEDWASAEAMDDAVSLVLPYDHDPVAQRIAGHLVYEHAKAWDAVGRRMVDERWCPEERANLFVLSYSNRLSSAVAVETVEQLHEVKADLMSGGPFRRCNTRVSRHCDLKAQGSNAEYPVEFLAVKYRVYICAFIACQTCFNHIKSGARFNNDYIGPTADIADERPAGSQGWV